MKTLKDFYQFIQMSQLKNFPKMPGYQQFYEELSKTSPFIVLIMQIFMNLHKPQSGN